jgi:hypothetical protein
VTDKEEAMAQMMEQYAKAEPIIDRLVETGIDPITAHVMANDILSADRATERVMSGEVPAERAVYFVGSYARWDWVLTMMSRGLITDDWFAENICDLWSGSDPDDTNADYLRLWQRLWRKNGGHVIRDGRPLPKGGADGMLKVYRGGHPMGIRNGFAWTTDPKIARKFAVSFGGRAQHVGGVVITGLVKPSHVCAFITRRGESEVIVDPRMVKDIHPTGAGS